MTSNQMFDKPIKIQLTSPQSLIYIHPSIYLSVMVFDDYKKNNITKTHSTIYQESGAKGLSL